MPSFFVLLLLTKEPMHGKKIAQEIAKRRGAKPTPGRIYLALKDLSQRGLIKREKQGKKNIAHARADKGTQGMEGTWQCFYRAFDEIFEEQKSK